MIVDELMKPLKCNKESDVLKDPNARFEFWELAQVMTGKTSICQERFYLPRLMRGLEI